MIKKFINAENVDEADVVIVSAPYEKTASFHKGTAEGPKKIIDCMNYQLDWFDRDLKVEAVDFIKSAHVDLEGMESLSPEDALKKIQDTCDELVNKEKFVFLLGGEHSVSLGHFKALAEKHDPKDVTILHIDAHCDLRDDDSDYNDKSPSKLAHSTVMRRANELGYNLVQVGIRTYYKGEYEYFSDPKNRVKVFEWGLPYKPGIDEILNSIKTKNVYLSIDTDGFDPAHMPGTGTPIQGGLEWWYGWDLIAKLVKNFNLIGADIVEVSPLKDSVVTELGAAQLVYMIVANKFKSKFS